MTDERIAATMERCEKATPIVLIGTPLKPQNAEFFENAKLDMQHLLTELANMTARAEKAEKEVERLKGAVNEIENDNDKAEFYISSLTEEVEQLRVASDNKCDACACELLARAEKAEAELERLKPTYAAIDNDLYNANMNLEHVDAELAAYKETNPPRVHGEWITLERASNAKFNPMTGVSTINLIYEGTVCSLCGEDGEREWVCCPACGCDMRKEPT